MTTTPSTRPTTGVVALMVSWDVSSFMPALPISFIRPMASPMPPPIPRIEPVTPSMTASISTDLLTWRRLEPRARIRPISRVRWATSIEKVLTIRKMPTRTEMPAKPSIAYFMKFRKLPTSFLSFFLVSAAVSIV